MCDDCHEAFGTEGLETSCYSPYTTGISVYRSQIHVLLPLALVGAIIGGGDASAATTASPAIIGGSSRLWNNRDVSQRRMPEIIRGVIGQEFNVTTDGANATEGYTLEPTTDANLSNPLVWHSTLCMEKWGMSVLQEEPDPNGYVIYVNGREQLGGIKYLASDGLFLAKTLNRTFVEYPVKDSRVASFDSKLGLGAYWDLSVLCPYHRILDLGAFRSLISKGLILADEFVTIRSDRKEFFIRKMKSEEDIQRHLKTYQGSKVIVLEDTWRTYVNRYPLKHMVPNPLYNGIVRGLLREQEDWGKGNFIAVQWRTETSTGDLMGCYEELRESIEKHRTSLGFGVHQVMFNTDLDRNTTSGTYNPEKRGGEEIVTKIVRDYPNAFHNKIDDFVNGIQDTGIKAFVTGLAVAFSKLMITSSYRTRVDSSHREPNRCQKPSSGYIHMIVEWREKTAWKDRHSVVRVFDS